MKKDDSDYMFKDSDGEVKGVCGGEKGECFYHENGQTYPAQPASGDLCKGELKREGFF